MLRNQIPDAPNATTSEPAPQTRHVVVGDRAAALGLTGDGQDATTFLDIVREPKESVEGWLGDHPAVVIDDGSNLATAAITKLQRDEIPTVVVHRDRRDR